MIEKGKKILSSLLIFFLLFGTFSTGYAANNTKDKNILKKIEKIREKQKLKEKFYGEKIGEAQKLIQNYEGEVNKKGKLYKQKNKAKIEKALRDAQKTKLEILKTSNEKLKENFEIELKNEFSPDLIKDLNLEPNYMYEFQALSNDPQINSQWGISNILGNAQNAELSYNGSDVKIAIIDTGVDFSIPDLVGSAWKDPSCVNHENILIPNGCNGGYDFVNNDTNPYPDEKLSHGSNVASIIASEINNSTAGASFAGNKAKLMSLRVAGGSSAYITSENIAKAIYFAVYNDAKIINMSLGGPTYSQVMYDALAFAKEKGVLVIAAAGNYASNNDTTPIYPANYSLDNIISVASVNSSNTLSSFSNYGANTVDLAAPGENITTYGVNAAQQTINGTSFSTPFTVSVAARYASQDTSLDYLQLKNKILEKSESQSLLAGKVIANKQLRIDPNSLTLLQTPPENPEPTPVDPAPVTPPVQPPTQDTPSTLKEEYAQMMLDVAKLRQGNVSLKKQNKHISIQELGSLETKLSDFYFAEKAYLDKRADISSEKKTQYLNLLKDQLGLTKDFNTSYKAFLQSKQSTQSVNAQNIDEISQKILKDLGVAAPKEETQILSDMSNFRFEENKASSQTMKSAKIIQTDESLTPQTNIGKNFIQGVIPETFAPLKKQDFGEDTNIVIDESIKNLAGELENNPVNIYNYVKNNIHFEAYYGSKKSSINCLQDKSCNDIDQANLTIALLRASGIPARYKTNSILVTKQNVQKLLGVNDLKLAFLILSKANIPVYRVNNGTPTPPTDLSQVNMDADTHIVFEWTGVEALIKHNDVGGNYSNDVFFDLSQDDAGLQSQIAEKDGIEWVYFDTAFQFVSVNNPAKNNTDLFTAGSVSIPTFFTNYLKNPDYTDVITTLKNIFYQTVPSLVSAPAEQKETEYKKYLYSPTPQKSKVDFIPLGLPYQIVEGTLTNGEVLTSKTLSQLGNNQVQNYEIIIKRQSNDEIVFQNSYTVDQINNVPFSLDYVGFTQADRDTISNYGSLNLTPSSLVDLGIVIDSQAIPSSTLTQEKSVKIGEGLIITYNYKLGSTLLDSSSKFSIGGNQEGMYFTFGKLRADNLTDNSQVLLAGNWAIAKKYLQKVQTGGDELASMLNVQNDLNVARAVVTQNRILNTTNGIATNFDFKGLSIDSHIFVKDFSRKSYGDNSTRSPNFRKLFGLLASQEEATIFQELTGLSAISTVNGLQYAHFQSGSYTVHTITPSNISLIDTLEFSLNTKNAMKTYINEGKTLITPNKPIENQNWKGVLYLAIDQATGEGVYAIGEQVVGNGGWTVDEFITNENHDAYTRLLVCNSNGGNELVGTDNLCESKYIEKTNDTLCANFSYISENFKTIIQTTQGYNKSIHGELLGKYSYLYHDVILTQKYAKFINNSSASSGLKYNYWISAKDIKHKLETYLITSNQKKNNNDIYKYSDVGTFIVWEPDDQIASYYSPNSNNGNVYKLKGDFLRKADSKYGGDTYKIKTIGVIGIPISEEKELSTTINNVPYSYLKQDFLNGNMFRYTNFYNFGLNSHYISGDIANYWKNNSGSLGLPKESPNFSNPTYITQNFDKGKFVQFDRTNKEIITTDIGLYMCTEGNYGSLKRGKNNFLLDVIGIHGIVTEIGALLSIPINVGISIAKGLIRTKDEFGSNQYYFDELKAIWDFAKEISTDDVIVFLVQAGEGAKANVLKELTSEQTTCDARQAYISGRITGIVVASIVSFGIAGGAKAGKMSVSSTKKMIEEISKDKSNRKLSEKIDDYITNPCVKSTGLQNLQSESQFCLIILNADEKVKEQIEHIMKAKPKKNGGSYTGLHSLNELKKSEYKRVVDSEKYPDTVNKPYNAKVEILNNGVYIPKGNNNGITTLFPDSRTREKIMEEVENAVKYNQGKDNLSIYDNEYYGFSKDGTIQINFYLNEDGTLGSYFPKLY